jgi:lipopolysaccharide assembly outer membrane protein LptD (OstA)
MKGYNAYSTDLSTLNISVIPLYSPYKDTTKDDTLKKDSVKVSTDISTSAIKSKVKYKAKDTIVYDIANEKVFLYGNAQVDYEDITLNADYIEINWTEHTVYAEGRRDSTGEFLRDSSGDYVGMPVFSEKSDKFNAFTIKYNFDTKKGKITHVTTKQGDGYIHGELVKKESGNSSYMKDGKYTTCDKDTPDYYIAAHKLKVIQGEKIITGPAYLVIGDVPFPIAVPFGLFPSKTGRASGIIIPTYGDSPTQGFYLQRGGYYFGISDHFDAAVRGDIYTKGSWAYDLSSDYSNRYHYSGTFEYKKSFTQIGDPEVPATSSTSHDYNIIWHHSQDPKARPGSMFSASVNLSSTSYFTNTLSSGTGFLTNTFASSISYSKDFGTSPFHLSASITHTQNDFTKEIDVSAPNLNFNMSSIYPFKNSNNTGTQKWYEKISISSSSQLENNLKTYDSLFPKKINIDQFTNGVDHVIPISTSFKVLKNFTLTPNLTWNERWYIESIKEQYYPNADSINVIPQHGFKRAGDGSASASLSTTIYGMYAFKTGNIVAIRHVITPSMSFTYRPDFSMPNFKYYETIHNYNDSLSQKYSYFQNGIFGPPSSGESNTIGFNLDNNLEMKVKTHTDTSEGTKKIKIFESLSLGGSYNFVADSLKLSHISLQGRTTLFDKIQISAAASLDPYQFNDSTGVDINKYMYDKNKSIGTITNASATCSFALNPDALKPQTSKKGTTQEQENVAKHPGDYIDFKIPWNLSVNYNLYYNKSINSTLTSPITQVLNFTGDLKLTPKWKIAFTSGYDFVAHDISYSSLSFYRDLHCWEMHLNWVPFGSHQSYSFQINVKSSILQDLKLVRKKDWYDTTTGGLQ